MGRLWWHVVFKSFPVDFLNDTKKSKVLIRQENSHENGFEMVKNTLNEMNKIFAFSSKFLELIEAVLHYLHQAVAYCASPLVLGGPTVWDC